MARKPPGFSPHDLAVARAVVAGEDPPDPPPEPPIGRPPVHTEPSGEVKVILDALAATVAPLEAAQAMVAEIQAARTELYRRGRALVPPLPNERMGEAVGLTGQAVYKAVKLASSDP